MDLELFEERTTQVSLILELLHENALLIEALQILNNADLFSRVDFFIILEKFLHNFLKHALLRCVFRLRYK